MINPVEFIQQVRREVTKITWPTRNEVLVTTLMVFILVTLAAAFFLIIDQILVRIVKFVLGLGA